jgi:hypothetical protein
MTVGNEKHIAASTPHTGNHTIGTNADFIDRFTAGAAIAK